MPIIVPVTAVAHHLIPDGVRESVPIIREVLIVDHLTEEL